MDLPRGYVSNLERGDAVIGQEAPEGLRDQIAANSPGPRTTQPRVLNPIRHPGPPL